MTLIKAIDLAITYMRCYQMALKLKRPDKHMSKRFLVTDGYKKRLPIRTENLATVFYTVLPDCKQ